MKAITATALRDNLDRYLEDVALRGERIVIARDGDEGDDRGVLLMPLDEIDETEYLLSSEANRRALMESLEQAKRGDVVQVQLSDLLTQEVGG